MTISLGILTAIIILLMLGAGQRILDGLRLNDKQAIIILLLIAIGIAIPPIHIGEYFAVSIGGYIIPFMLCIYLLVSCGWSRDLLRATIGTIVVAGVIYGLDWLMPSASAEDIVVDNTFLYGIVAGIVAYTLGRSRRNAFVSAILGISLSQTVQWLVNIFLGTPTVLGLGTGGAFGTYVIAALISVGLAEFFGRAFTTAKPDEEKKEFNFDTHTYDSEKNGKLEKKTHTKQKLSSIAIIVAASFAVVGFVGVNPNQVSYAAETVAYYTIYDYNSKEDVVLYKGGIVENGDLYLSGDNKLYEIVGVNEGTKTAYAKYIKDEELPEYNITRVSKLESVAYAKSKKYVGVYHTHNDESYFTPDGTDSVYGKGGIHDVGKQLVKNFQTLGIETEYDESLHLPHNSGAYTRSQATAKKLLDKGVTAIFDIHRDSTPRKEYATTVNGKEMSKVRMVVGSSNQNFEENKKFAYSIKAYADKAYPNLIKDIYMGGGNYNQQLSPFAMLFEFGSENIEKDLAIASTEPLSKTIDVVLFGSQNASAYSLQDISLKSGDGTTNVIAGLSNEGSGASWSSLWIVLGLIGTAILGVGIACIFSKNARYKVSRFFSELFAGVFTKKRARG
ncbi:MAG: stage II sporulation protein P [Clostridia bacterium]|nr:stage II sporulation protein P [Clostridia bacterium]